MSKSSEARQNKKAKRLLPGLIALAFFSVMSADLQSCIADDSMSASLSKLEAKYFQHDFSKDEAGERLERIEKLVFGEARSGNNETRLKNLLELVPNLDSKAEDNAAPANQSRQTSTEQAAPARSPSTANHPAAEPSDNEPIANDNSYPAVTAIEKKLLGRDYIGESLGKRLDRLEIKAFGKTSASEDLQDRLDRLKSSTGIDVARLKPANSEWADEDEDPNMAGLQGVQPFSGIGADDPAAQRNYRKQQAQSAFNRPRPAYDPYAGTGTFGAGGALPPASGSYSSGTFGAGVPGSNDRMPPSAPDFSTQTASSAPIPAPQMGVSQQIAMLEREVFNKTYDKETLLNRLARLEATVFPQDKPVSDKSLPERMSRLLAAVPLSQAPAEAPQAKRRRGGDPDFPDLDFGSPSNLSQQPSQPQAQARGQGGLSKIINGLGNAISGGYSGSYAATPGTLITDPSTGLLYDQYTGTYIDPMTGAVVSRRSVNYGLGGMGSMNNYGYPAYGGFNSGLSPMMPYRGMGGLGNMGGMGFGFGGGGMRIGF